MGNAMGNAKWSAPRLMVMAVILSLATSVACATTHGAVDWEEHVRFGVEEQMFTPLDLAFVRSTRAGLFIHSFEFILFDDLDGDGACDAGEARYTSSAQTTGMRNRFCKIAFMDLSSDLASPWVQAEAETSVGVARASWPFDS